MRRGKGNLNQKSLVSVHLVLTADPSPLPLRRSRAPKTASVLLLVTALVLAGCGVPAAPSVTPTPFEIVSTGEYVWHEGETFLSQSGSSGPDFKSSASNGQCLGMGWGNRRGNFVEYEVDFPFDLPRAALYIRYAREGRWAAELDVYASGKLIGASPSMVLKPTGGWGYTAGEWKYGKLLLGSMEAGKYGIKFVSLVDFGEVNIDGFFIADESFTVPRGF